MRRLSFISSTRAEINGWVKSVILTQGSLEIDGLIAVVTVFNYLWFCSISYAENSTLIIGKSALWRNFSLGVTQKIANPIQRNLAYVLQLKGFWN